MPDLDDDLIARLSDAARDHGGDWEGRLFAEAAARLTAAAEERERMELGHASLSAVRQSQYQAKEAEWIAEMEKRERAVASLNAEAEERAMWKQRCIEAETYIATADTALIATVKKLAAQRKRNEKSVDYSVKLQELIESLKHDITPHADLYHYRIVIATKASLAAAAERERGLREALREQVILELSKPDENTCALCRLHWLPGEPERHAPGCLAALAKADTAEMESLGDSAELGLHMATRGAA